MSGSIEKNPGPHRLPGSPHGRVGRPRANPRPLERPPEEEILVVAARLFIDQGFTKTSTREIAEAAGLRQPSLFHYYPRKETILEVLLARSGEWALAHAQQLEALPHVRASAKLYRALFFDVYNLCSGVYAGAALRQLPEVRPPSFPEFWALDGQVTEILERFVAEGVSQRDFAPSDAALTAASLRAMSGSVTSCLARGERYGAEELGHHVAGLSLRALLADPQLLERVRDEASRLRV